MEGNRIRLASDFYITRDGTPAASIVVRTGAPDKVMEAARDLQDIIRRMSGAELPICDDAFRVEGNKILLGPSGYTRIHNVVFPEQKGEWCLLRRREAKLSSLATLMQRFPQTMVNIQVSPEGKLAFYTDHKVKEAIDRAAQTLGRDGRIIVRPSGTEPLLRVMVEGQDEDLIEKLAQDVAQVIREELV